MDKPSYLSDVDWAEWQRKRGSDPLTARAAREWRAERDRREPLNRPNPHRYIDTPQDIRLEEEAQKRKDLPCGVTLDDFRAYMPMHRLHLHADRRDVAGRERQFSPSANPHWRGRGR